MSFAEYQKALKMGDKEYRACVNKDTSPYLPVLDEIVAHENIEAQVPLGLVQIPLKSIVGTYSAGRTTAFARNFMVFLVSLKSFYVMPSTNTFLVILMMPTGYTINCKAVEC